MKSFFISFLLLIICSLSQTRADSQSDYQQQIKQLGKEIKKISKNLNANKKLLKTEQHKLLETEKKITRLIKKSAKTELKIIQKQQQVQAIDLQIERLKTERFKGFSSVKELILKQYINGQPNYLKMLLNQQNPYAVGRLSHYYYYYQAAYAKKLAELAKKLSKLKRLQDQHTESMVELTEIKQQQTNQQQQLEEFKKKRKKIIGRLDKKVENSSSRLKKLQQNRDRLNTLLKKIAKQAAEMRRLQKKREQQEKLSSKPTPRVVTKPVKGGFKKQKGRLNLPVKGKPKYRFGARIAASGMLAEGMLIETDTNQAVQSIFRGRVVFADWLKGYGLLIIVDHGDNHISLYGHNQLLYKQVGDMVETNEIIAKSGVTGGLKKPGVYFEIRHHATPVNPSLWCK